MDTVFRCTSCGVESRTSELYSVATHPELNWDPQLGGGVQLRFKCFSLGISGGKWGVLDPLLSPTRRTACPQCLVELPGGPPEGLGTHRTESIRALLHSQMEEPDPGGDPFRAYVEAWNQRAVLLDVLGQLAERQQYLAVHSILHRWTDWRDVIAVTADPAHSGPEGAAARAREARVALHDGRKFQGLEEVLLAFRPGELRVSNAVQQQTELRRLLLVQGPYAAREAYRDRIRRANQLNLDVLTRSLEAIDTVEHMRLKRLMEHASSSRERFQAANQLLLGFWSTEPRRDIRKAAADAWWECMLGALKSLASGVDLLDVDQEDAKKKRRRAELFCLLERWNEQEFDPDFPKMPERVRIAASDSLQRLARQQSDIRARLDLHGRLQQLSALSREAHSKHEVEHVRKLRREAIGQLDAMGIGTDQLYPAEREMLLEASRACDRRRTRILRAIATVLATLLALFGFVVLLVWWNS